MKKILNLLIILLLSFLSTGCWNYYELNDLAIITGMGIDKKDDEYFISIVIGNTTESTNGEDSKAKTTLISSEGKTMTEAYDNLKKITSKELYFGHLSLILVSEVIAKDGIYDILDRMFRNPETIKRVNMVIAKDNSANEILKVVSPLESFPSQNILFNIKNSNINLGVSSNMYLSDFLYKTINHGFDNILPSISIKGKESGNNSDDLKETEIKSNLKVDDIAMFNGYKLIDYAQGDENKMINLLTNTSRSMNIKLPCYRDLSKYVIVKIEEPKTKISLIKNKLKYKFTITSRAALDETNCKLNLNDEEVIETISNYTGSEVYEKVTNLLEKTQNLKTDIFGLGNMLYKKNYQLWKLYEKDWENIYSNLEYDIDIKINLDSNGAIKNTIKEVEK